MVYCNISAILVAIIKLKYLKKMRIQKVAKNEYPDHQQKNGQFHQEQ